MAWPVISRTRASAVPLTNWPSSTGGGALLFFYLMVDMKEQGKDTNSTSENCVVTQETLLKLSKEIAIKFIEVGRVTPATFPESFADIYKTLKTTVTNN
ncbi:hypothetical protein [Desulfopila sp. IMCC35008]|uniref:hypothetical protein n=1 Tax=Desulfopila sp. IMCC35008 TaxID=2653858 RepID=UPI001F0D037D|nr:hypothetical protein [Desulfopila sp. IMCC35008]